MLTILHLFGMFVVDLFKSRNRLEAENLFLRHQLNVALRRAPARLRLRGSDRALMIWLVRLWPGLLSAAQVVHNSALASRGVQSVLALEVTEEGGAAKD